jgi:hypothetical protein
MYPNERYLGAVRTSSPIQAATRDFTDWGNIDMGIGTEAQLRARLMALQEILGQLDPNDRIGASLIKQETAKILAKINRISNSTASAVTESNQGILEAQMRSVDSGFWTDELTPDVPFREYVNPGEPAENASGYSQGPQMYDWMQDIWTPQGLRPLAGDYALDPIQQQQAAQWWTYSQNKPTTIEGWLSLQPQVELTAEQWRQQSERITPKRTNSVNWLAAAAR